MIHLEHPITRLPYSQCRLEPLSDITESNPRRDFTASGASDTPSVAHAFLYGIAIKNKNKCTSGDPQPDLHDELARNLARAVLAKSMCGKISPGTLSATCKSILGNGNAEIRKRFSWVGPDVHSSWLVPPPYQHVPDYLDDISDFVNACGIHPKELLTYFAFQWLHVHPLEDGNGRSCRALTIALANRFHEDLYGISLAASIAQKHDLMMAEWDRLRSGNPCPAIELATATAQLLENETASPDIGEMASIASGLIDRRGIKVSHETLFLLFASGGVLSRSELEKMQHVEQNKLSLQTLGIRRTDDGRYCLIEIFMKREAIRKKLQKMHSPSTAKKKITDKE